MRASSTASITTYQLISVLEDEAAHSTHLKGNQSTKQIHESSFPAVHAQKNSSLSFELNYLQGRVHQAVQKITPCCSTWESPGVTLEFSHTVQSGVRQKQIPAHM